MKSLITNAHDSAAFANGSKTAFVVPVPSKYIINDDPSRYKSHGINEVGALFEDLRPEITPWIAPIQLPYALNERVYLREPWYSIPDNVHHEDNLYFEYPDKCWEQRPWNSPATMPRSAARRWVTPVKCEVVRCRDMSEEQSVKMGIKCLSKDGGKTFKYGIPDEDGLPGGGNQGGWPWREWEVKHIDAVRKYITAKHGASFWDNNGWLFYYEVKQTNK